jgi:small subunit ribosomal protein S8e
MNIGRKKTGGRYRPNRKKKSYEIKGQERKTIIGQVKRKLIKERGGNMKIVTLSSNSMNIAIDGKVKKAEIKNVLETPQNKFFARQNRLMKGSIVDTSLGKARITNRPSQEGCVNGVLVPEKA